MFRAIKKSMYNKIYDKLYKALVNGQGKWDMMGQANDNLYTLCSDYDHEWLKPPTDTQRQAASVRLNKLINKEINKLNEYKDILVEARAYLYASTFTPDKED